MQMVKKIFLLVLVSLILATMTGVVLAGNNSDWPKEIKMGVIPTESSSELSSKFEPIVKQLEKDLNIKITLTFASDYRGIIEALRFKQIEMAHLGPLAYVEAADNYGNVEPAAQYIGSNGSHGYRSCIIANTKTSIYCPEDAKGANYAFNDPNSTSGYLVPLTFFLQQMKIDPDKYFGKVTFSGSHEASIIAVANGTVDMASTNLYDLKKAITNNVIKESSIRVIWVSSLIPNDPIVIRKDLPASMKSAIRDALLDMGTKNPAALKPMQWAGFAQADDDDYQPIRDLQKVKKALDAKTKTK